MPLTLAAFGIVLRGSSFAFRKTVFRTRDSPAPSGARAVATVGAVLIVVPGFVLLYILDQRSLLPDEGAE